MPAFKHLKHLEAALARAAVPEDSPSWYAFGTGWLHCERGWPAEKPGWYASVEECVMYFAGHQAGVAAGVKGSAADDSIQPAAKTAAQSPMLPPHARFELAKAALTGFCAWRGSPLLDSSDELAGVAKGCWYLADAMLAAMESRDQERSEAA
jgi:hypothetical protein